MLVFPKFNRKVPDGYYCIDSCFENTYERKAFYYYISVKNNQIEWFDGWFQIPAQSILKNYSSIRSTFITATFTTEQKERILQGCMDSFSSPFKDVVQLTLIKQLGYDPFSLLIQLGEEDSYLLLDLE